MSMDFAELSQCVTTVTKGEVREAATQLYSVWKVFWVYIQDGTCRLENTPVQAVAHPRVLWTSSLPGRPQHVVGGIPTSKPYKQTWKDIHICSTILCMFFQVRCTKNIVAYWMLAWAQCHCSSDKLFFDGFEDNQGHVWFLAIVGFKGDLKFFARAGYLQRSFEHVGRVRNLEMCHECMGGSSEYPFEEVTSDTPKWIQTIYSQRPWVNEPPLLKIPYHPNEPERQMKKDCFHLCKVGIYRDFVACSILWLLFVGYFGHDGDVDTKLGRAYKVFYLFCSTTGRTPGLRSFNKNFFNFPKLSSFGWANTKGSDTMHLVAWIKVLCVSCKNDLLSQEHLKAINLISFTADAASTFFRRVNSHGLFLTFHCGVALWADLRSFIRGYAALAHLSFTKLKFPGFSMKPKLHLLRHLEHAIFTILSNPNCRYLWNPIAHGCEMNEDFIGRACRLSRKCSTQLLCQRVLQSILLKADFLNRRWQQFGPRSCGRSSKSKAAQRIRGK